MWDPIWDGLSADRDVIRLDLRGFGDSTARPDGPLCSVDDVTATLTWLGTSRFHLVGASFGAGVAVETALTHPDAVASLLLARSEERRVGEEGGARGRARAQR